MGFLKKALGAVNPFGSRMKDMFLGAKDLGTKDRIIDLDPSLKKSVEGARANQYGTTQLIHSELEKLKGQDPSSLADLRERAAMSRAQKLFKQQGEDQRSRAQELVAQRGLGRSSVGIGAIMRADQPARDRYTSFAAMSPLRKAQMQDQLQQQRLSSIGRLGGMASQILMAPGAQRQTVLGRQGTGKRSGGMLKRDMQLGGSIVGGWFGGPSGAKAGGEHGGGTGEALANF